MGTDEDLEIFGPLLQVRHYNNFDEAIAIANKTKYGLAAGLLSEDLQQQKQFYQQAKAGIVNINQPMTGASSKAPFGGIGLSGNHRPSAFYAADFCAYPVASMVADKLVEPETKLTGMNW
jgi:succinylglutamic semialdehyde dehydrogenase